MSYTEQTGWYHAEGDPLDTKRFWDGSESVSYTHLTLPTTPYV